MCVSRFGSGTGTGQKTRGARFAFYEKTSCVLWLARGRFSFFATGSSLDMDARKAKYLSRGTSALGPSRTFSMRARFCWTAATAAVTALLPTRPPSPPMLRRKGAMVSSFTASAGKSPAEPNPLSFIPTPSMPHGPAHRNKPRGRRGGGQRSVGERERARSLCAKSEGARWRSDDARVPGRGRGDRQPSESAPLIAAPRRVVVAKGPKKQPSLVVGSQRTCVVFRQTRVFLDDVKLRREIIHALRV